MESVRDFLESVKAGLLPRGHPRKKKLLVWSKEDIEAMVWLEQNRQRLAQITNPDERDKVDEQEDN